MRKEGGRERAGDFAETLEHSQSSAQTACVNEGNHGSKANSETDM